LRAPTTGLARYDQDARIFQSSKHAHYHLLARHAASAFELHGAEDWPLKQNIEQGYRVLRMGNADDFLSETSGSAGRARYEIEAGEKQHASPTLQATVKLMPE